MVERGPEGEPKQVERARSVEELTSRWLEEGRNDAEILTTLANIKGQVMTLQNQAAEGAHKAELKVAHRKILGNMAELYSAVITQLTDQEARVMLEMNKRNQ